MRNAICICSGLIMGAILGGFDIWYYQLIFWVIVIPVSIIISYASKLIEDYFKEKP